MPSRFVLAEKAHHRVAPTPAKAHLVVVGRALADQPLDVDRVARDHTAEGLLVRAAEGSVYLAVTHARTQRERNREVESRPGVLDPDATASRQGRRTEKPVVDHSDA